MTRIKDESLVYYTYRIFDPSVKEYIYIGKGKNTRWKEHIYRPRKKQSWLQNRIKKMRVNGFEPLVDFICKDVDEEFALLVEMEAIAKYGRRDLNQGCLLNMTNGGEGQSGFIRTVATRKKLSESIKASYKNPEILERKCKAQKIAQNQPATKAKRNATFSKPEWKQKHSEILKAALATANIHRRRPCTVDGITIYSGVRVLIKALGQGKNGSFHPNFRYV